MKIRKEFVIALLLCLNLHMVMGQLLIPHMFIKWSTDIWNLIKTGSRDRPSSAMFQTCSKSPQYTEALFKRTAPSLVKHAEDIKQSDIQIDTRLKNMAVALNRLPHRVDLGFRLTNLYDKVDLINKVFDEFQSDLRNGLSVDQWCDKANIEIKSNSMVNWLREVRTKINERLLHDLIEDLKMDSQKNLLCGQGHSPYDFLHTIYYKAVIAEMKAYIVHAYYRHYLYKYYKTTKTCNYFAGESEDHVKTMHQSLQAEIRKYTELFIANMESVSKEFWACDKEDFTRDVSYFELEGSIQHMLTLPKSYPTGVFDTNLKLEKSKHEKARKDGKSVGQGLPNAEKKSKKKNDDYAKSYCNKDSLFCISPIGRPCLGRLTSCKKFAKQAKACISEYGPKRYDWIEKQTSKIPKECPSNRYHQLSTTSDDDSIHTCTCYDTHVNSPSTHVFNLQWVEADVEQNMVVTGLRFTVHQRIMQLQIQQGKLGENGQVKNETWKPVKDISEDIRAHRLGRTLRGEQPKVAENIDYWLIRRDHFNYIKFDTLAVPNGHVLTGVKLNLHDKSDKTLAYIEIAIKSRPFDLLTGKLNINATPALTFCPAQKLRKHGVVTRRHPIKGPEATYPLGMKSTPIISQMPSEYGQVTLPYFDGTPLVTNPVAPLGGVGMFYKANKQFAGYVSLRFLSIDHVHHMKESLAHKDMNLSIITDDPNVPDFVKRPGPQTIN